MGEGDLRIFTYKTLCLTWFNLWFAVRNVVFAVLVPVASSGGIACEKQVLKVNVERNDGHKSVGY